MSQIEPDAPASRRARLVLAAVTLVAVAAGTIGWRVLTDDPEVTTTPGAGTGTSTTTTAAPPATTTTSTTAAPTSDDRVEGWPGPVARVFDDPQAAALAFATEVLELPAPSPRGQPRSDGADVLVEIDPRPGAGVATVVRVHDTGSTRGWIVTGATSAAGTVTEVRRDGAAVVLTGSATAFEATLLVSVRDVEGFVLAETTTVAGANGEQGPYEVRIDLGDPAKAFWVLIGEGDASGEGRLIWASTAPVPAG